MVRLPARRDLLTSVGAFLLGLVLAAGATAAWLMAVTGGEREIPAIAVDTLRQIRERTNGRGEIATAQRTIAERLAAVRVPTNPLRGEIGIRAANITWRDGTRRPFLRAERSSGVLNIDAAEHGDIVVDDVTIRGANVLLDQPAPGGEWNYERVLADLLNDNGARDHEAERTVMFRNVHFENSRAEIRQPNRHLEFENINGLATRIQFSGPDVGVTELDIARLSALHEDVLKQAQLQVSAENARVRLPEGRVDFEAERATVGSARLANLEGRWEIGGPGLGLTMTGRANDVELSELAYFSERLPKEGRGSFGFAVRSLAGDALEIRLSDADVTAEGSRFRGAFALRTGGETLELISVDARLEPLALALVERLSGRDLPYAGAITGTVRGTGGDLNLDVTAELTADGLSQPFTTGLVGLIRYANGSITVRRLTADLRAVPFAALKPVAPGLPFRGAITGTVTLTGAPDRAPLTLDVRLDVAGGVAAVAGTLDLTDSVPAYDLNGRLIGLSLAQLLERPAPPALLTARFELRGRGVDPATADARVVVTGRFTEWRAEPGDTVVIVAQIRNGGIDLDNGVVNLGPLALEAAGDWRFIAPETGALRYHLAVDDLAPLAPYLPGLPKSAAGTLESTGTVAGSLSRMRIEGDLTGSDLELERWRVASVTARHQLVLGDSVPIIKIEGSARNIATPEAGSYSGARLNVNLTPPAFSLDLNAEQVDGGVIEVVATGHIPNTGARQIVLERARLDLDDSRWALAAPSTIHWAGGDGLNVRNFELRNESSEGHVRVDGRVFPFDNVDARVETAAFPVAEAERLLGREPEVTGLLWATADLRGPGTAPRFDIKFHLDSGSVTGVPFTRVEGNAAYAGQMLRANALATFDTTGVVDLKAALPMQVALAPEIKFDLLDSGPVEVSLVADSVALAPLATFLAELRGVQGALRANARVTGTVANPALSGSIAVYDGAATVITLNQRYTDVSADIVFDQRSAQVRSVRATSGGTAEVTGRIDFPELKNPVADLIVKLDRFRPIGVEDRDDASATGDVRVTGALLEPTITGSIRLDDGDIAVPQVGRSALTAEFGALGDPIEIAGEEEGGFYGKITLDNVRLYVDEGVWFSLQNARAQLEGDLVINKRGDDLRITGALTGQRGTYTLEAGPIVRRFQIVNADVRFRGTADINPAIDITARRTIIDPSGRQMEVDVRIGGTLEQPTLSLASADAATIPQSELLSFLLFGKPSLELAERGLPGEVLLQETLFGGIAELASLELEQAAGGIGLPLDIFQLRLGGSGIQGFESSTLVLGRELSDEVFLTVESGVAALFGPDENLTNTWAIRLEWRVDPNTSVRGGYGPANPSRLIRGLGVALPSTQQKQLSVELRRRWSW